MDILKNYWPLFLIVAWMCYKWWNTRRVLTLLPALKQKGAVLIDVRSRGEYSSGHALGTINIPLDELKTRINEISKESPVILCCASGTRSGMAKMTLKSFGFKEVYNVGTWSKLINT